MERDSLVRPSRLAFMMVVAVLLALLAAGTASAATPQEIYDDFAADLAKNGRSGLILVLVVLIPLLAIVLDSQVGRALASRLERRGLDAPADLTAERIAFLEGEVERLSSEVMRLDEEGQFLQKLLTERVESGTGELPPGDPQG